jgi:hypothetical protein
MSAPGDELPRAVTSVVEHIYELFGGHRCPEDLWVVAVWPALLRTVHLLGRGPIAVFSQLDAVHMMSLDDGDFSDGWKPPASFHAACA